MRTYKETTVREKRLDTVVCNMCGEEIGKNEFGYTHEHVTLEKQWGYGSPRDGETHHIDICQQCYEKLLSQMKIPPTANA